MSKPEHSPLPWAQKYKSKAFFLEGNFHVLTTCGDYPVSFIPAWDNPTVHEEDGTIEALENAQFIVTACNSYYDNKQAIAELVEALETCVEQNEGCFVNHYTFYREEAVTPGYIIKARALIAKHKAKP